MSAPHPHPLPKKRQRCFVLAPTAVFLFGAIIWTVLILHTHFKLEDALITFRYSRNILAGNGFVFNPGEHILGTTTPLQTLILAALAYPFGAHSVLGVAEVVMPCFGLLAGVAAYAALVKRGIMAGAAALAMALIYTNLEVIRTGIGGMETPLALLLMAASLWAFISEKPTLTGAFAALLVLCRIDGLIWCSLLFVLCLIKWKRGVWRPVAAFAAVLIPWIVFATLYFGNPVPNSMLAKGVIRPGVERSLLSHARIVRNARWYYSGIGIPELGWAAAIWIAALLVGACRIVRRSPRELGILAVFPVVYSLAMYAGRAPLFEWYLLPITFCCLIVAGVGFGELFRLLGRLSPYRVSRALPYVGVGLVVLLAGAYCRCAMPPIMRHLRMAQANEDGLRRTVGLWLHDNTPPGASVAMEAIGYQGFYSERPIVDIAGLVTPRVVHYKSLTRRNGQVFDWILRDFKPDYIVLRSFEVDANQHFNGGRLFLTPEKERAFHATYREARRFAAPYPESSPKVRYLTVFARVRE